VVFNVAVCIISFQVAEWNITMQLIINCSTNYTDRRKPNHFLEKPIAASVCPPQISHHFACSLTIMQSLSYIRKVCKVAIAKIEIGELFSINFTHKTAKGRELQFIKPNLPLSS
jgi:hypothetical protein